MQVGGAGGDEIVQREEQARDRRPVPAVPPPAAAAQEDGLLVEGDHRHLAALGQAVQQPAHRPPRPQPLRAFPLPGVREDLALDDVDQLLVGHGGAAVEEDRDPLALHPQPEQVSFLAGRRVLHHVRRPRGFGLLDGRLESLVPAPQPFGLPAQGVQGAAHRAALLLPRLGGPVQRRAAPPRLADAFLQGALPLAQGVQLGAQALVLRGARVRVVPDDEEQQDGRSQAARHDVQEGEVEPLDPAASERRHAAYPLMRLSRNSSQYAWVSTSSLSWER